MELKKLLLAIFVFVFSTNFTSAQTDEEQVRAAILDYVEGIYEVQPDRVKRSVHPELVKKGFWRPKDQAEYKDESVMTFDELVELAGKWNAQGWLPKDAPKIVEVYDVQDKTAVGKLTAHWGTDYFHLAKYGEQWMITNVLWQSPSPIEKTAKN